MERVDALVVGGGIAGASAAYELAGHGSVVLVEQETACGHHSTGRSAAVFTECYGSPTIRTLSMAGRALLEDPPLGFADVPLLSPRPLLFVGRVGQERLLDQMAAEYGAIVPGVIRLGAAETKERFPALRPGYGIGGVEETGAGDIDVHALHQGFLRGIRSRGSRVFTNARAGEFARANGRWRVIAGEHAFTTESVVDAAGAWGDVVAVAAGVDPLGLTPMRRTAFTVPGPGGHERWPMLIDAAEQWYLKPEGPNLLASPADETPVPPGDARYEETDVAVAIDRVNEATTLGIRHVRNAWAGLRTFTPDRVPAAGPDPDHPGFFWLVGQGGYGIKTAGPLARWMAAQVAGTDVPADLVEAGLTLADLDPARFR
jgi:D-arginine dehydrogenase